MVYSILSENKMDRFYELDPQAGQQVGDGPETGAYDFLADPEVRRRLIDFTDGTTTHVTFSLPQIHCMACVWLLERLYKLRDGIGPSEVNFTRKTLKIPFDENKISLVELAGLLAQIGYEPDFKLGSLQDKAGDGGRRRAWVQLGVAGFAFGNIMLLSFPGYLGVPLEDTPWLPPVFGGISLVLSLPVLLYSAKDYFHSAWLGLKHREISIDVPIALGILALFFQSAFDILRGVGEGYLDSLAGLVFFLLIGKSFQRRSFDALSFDRDYTHYFPMAALQILSNGSTATRSLDRLVTGDRLRIRNGELIPADAILMQGPALIDYSFVTGESKPEERLVGETLYAGGRHHGAPIEVEVIKEVSQSYLTSLWNHQSFRKDHERKFDRLTREVSKLFTVAVISIAFAAGGWWLWHTPADTLRIMSAILIVACPCALALSAPFAFGTALRILRKSGLYLKNGFVVEGMARVRHVAFDKTGTLTQGGLGSVTWTGAPLSPERSAAVKGMTESSTHPLSRAIAHSLHVHAIAPVAFREFTGKGIESIFRGQVMRIGSASWLCEEGVETPTTSGTWLALDQTLLGQFNFTDTLREGVRLSLPRLSSRYDLSVLTGDREEGLLALQKGLPPGTETRAALSPQDKLDAIDQLRTDGRGVMMVGDGLNDAGALRHSDVGIAVTEDIQTFTPACDAILEANQVPALPQFLHFSRLTVRVVLLSFAVSLLYNIFLESPLPQPETSPRFLQPF